MNWRNSTKSTVVSISNLANWLPQIFRSTDFDSTRPSRILWIPHPLLRVSDIDRRLTVPWPLSRESGIISADAKVCRHSSRQGHLPIFGDDRPKAGTRVRHVGLHRPTRCSTRSPFNPNELVQFLTTRANTARGGTFARWKSKDVSPPLARIR